MLAGPPVPSPRRCSLWVPLHPPPPLLLPPDPPDPQPYARGEHRRQNNAIFASFWTFGVQIRSSGASQGLSGGPVNGPPLWGGEVRPEGLAPPPPPRRARNQTSAVPYFWCQILSADSETSPAASGPRVPGQVDGADDGDELDLEVGDCVYLKPDDGETGLWVARITKCVPVQ